MKRRRDLRYAAGIPGYSGNRHWLFATVVMALIMASGPLVLSALAVDSPGGSDIFAESHIILSDQELLVVYPGSDSFPGSDPRKSYAKCFLPETFRDGKWVDADEEAWTNETPCAFSSAPGEFDATLARGADGTPFLGQAWCPDGGGAVSASLASVDSEGFGGEGNTFEVAADGHGVAVAAGDFTGDMATDLVIACADGGNGLRFAVVPASDDAEPVFTDISGVLTGAGVRIATGDADGDMVDELAALYPTPDGDYRVSLFAVSGDGAVSLRGSHGLGLSISDVSDARFDVAFADWDGSGRRKLACVVHADRAGGASPSGGFIAFRLFELDLPDEDAAFSEVFGAMLAEDVTSCQLRADAGDVDCDGREELVFGRSFKGYSDYLREVADMVCLDVCSHAPSGSGEPFRTTSHPVNVRPLGTDVDFDLALGNFTGQLNPAAGSDNPTQIAYMQAGSHMERGFSLFHFDGEIFQMDAVSSQRFWGGPPLALVPGDLDGDSMLLGAPTHITLENEITPLLFLDEPPKHVDGNASGEVTNYTRYSDLYLQYAQSETESGSTTNTLDMDANLGTSISLESRESLTAGGALESTTLSAKEKETFSSSVGARYEKINRDYSSQSTSLTGKTNRDDYVLFRCHTVHVWRYPVLGWFRSPDSGGDEGQAYYQVVIPDSSPEDQAVHLIPGQKVDWYQPVHMNGNALSYPSVSTQIPDFTEEGLLSSLVTLDVGGGNSASRTIEWSSESVREAMKSMKVSMAVDSETQLSASEKVDYFIGKGSAKVSTTASFHMDSCLSRSSSSSTSVTKENAFAAEVPAVSSPLDYSVTPLMYRTGGGVLKVDHLTGGIFGDTAWEGRYGGVPDPALNLPRTWEFKSISHSTEEEVWGWSDEPEAREIRGIFFRARDGGDLGVSIPLEDPFTVAVRVHNFSLAPLAPVTVLFEAATIDTGTGTVGVRSPLGQGTTTTSAIPEWGAPAANWQWAVLTVDSTDLGDLAEGNYRIFVTVDPEDELEELAGHDLNEPFDNNRGWFDVFFHRTEAVAGTAGVSGADETEPGLACSLEAADPENGFFYAAGEEVAFTGRVVNESGVSVRDLMVFFYDGDPADGGMAFDVEHVAGVLPGAAATLSVRHAFGDERTRQVFMKVHPKPGYTDNVASAVIPMADGSGGCSTGMPGPGGVFGTVLLLGGTLFMMRRR